MQMVVSRARAFVRRILTRQLTSKLEFEDAIAVTPVSEVFGLDRGTPFADLTQPETVPEARFDTFICTQTFNFIFNLDPAIESVHKLLRPGGHALITVAGISQISRYDYERWGDYWRFTDLSLGKLLSRKFSPADCSLTTFGNVATSCLFLQGVSVEDIPDKSILNITDPNYQMIVCALVKKSE
jgi:SAM-dependent methyltransferase